MRKLYNLLGLMLVGLALAPAALAAADLPYSFIFDDVRPLATTNQYKNQRWQRQSKDGNYYLRVQTTSSTDFDCWVAFEELEFKAGKTYCVTITGGVWYGLPSYNDADHKGSFEVFYASGTPASNSTVSSSYPGIVTPIGSAIFSEPDYSIGCQSAAFTTRKYYFVADQDRTARLALHNTSKGKISYFCIGGFQVEEIEGIVPAAPKAFSVTPDPDGLKQADFSVTAPEVDVFGNPLTSLSNLSIFSKEREIWTQENPTPGQTYTFTKEFGQLKSYSFRAFSTLDGANGPELVQYTTIGLDLGDKGWEYTTNYQEANGPVGKFHNVAVTYLPAEGYKVVLTPLKRKEGAKYDIIRMPGNVKVASDLDTPEFTDSSVPADSRLTYYYNVLVKTEDTEQTFQSHAISLNNLVPYFVDFNDMSNNTFAEFSFIDNDNNCNSWGGNGAGGMGSSGKDDYLVSPGVKLEKGKYYRFTSTMRGGYGNMSATLTSMETWYGTSNTVEGLNLPLNSLTDIKERTQNEAYFTPPETGNYFFAVRHIVYNNSSNNLMVYDYSVEEVSPDLPDAVTDLKVSYTGGANATISFIASPKNIAGQDQPSLTKIEILKDGELYKTLENPVPGQAYSEDVTFTAGEQSIYSFVPYSSAGKGTADDILVMLLNTPYTQDFTAPTALNGYTIIDVNKDDHTWNIHNEMLRSYPGMATEMDEWVVLPPVQLAKDMFYKVSADAFCCGYYYDKNDGSKISLYIGTKPEIENLMETPVITDRQIFEDDKTGDGPTQNIWEYISVPEDGQYFIAWRLVQDGTIARPCELAIDNIRIEQGKSGMLPDAGKLTVTPDPDGGEFVTCEIELPAKKLNGEAFDSSTYVRTAAIFLDDNMNSPVWSRNNFSANESGLQVKLPNIPTGKHKFTLMCGTGTSTGSPYLGREEVVYAFVGINAPSHPISFTARATEVPGEVTLDWVAPATDELGFPIQPQHIFYALYELVPRTLPNDQVVYDEIEIVKDLQNVLTYTYQCVPSDAKQAWKRFVIRTATTAGAAQAMLTAEPIAVGLPDELPYVETFAKMNSTHLMQNKAIVDNSAMWGANSIHPAYGDEPIDKDGGLAVMEALGVGATAGLTTGNIKITGKAPRLSLYLYAGENKDNLVTNGFNVQVLEGSNPWTIIDDDKPIHTWSDEFHGWQKITLDLSPYVGKTIRLAFVGTAGSDQFTVMDHIVIDENPETDMAIKALEIPEEVYVGQPVTATVHFKNLGSHYKWNGNIELHRNGVKVAEQAIESPAGQLASVQLTDVVPASDSDLQAGIIKYEAKIVDANDVDLLDNVSRAIPVLLVDNANFPTVINLTGEKSPQGVDLAWEAPSIPAEGQEFTDDFESYPSWNGIATGIGTYSLIDADLAGVSYIDNLDWPIERGSRQAFFVADFSDPCFDYWHSQNENYFKAHSGSKVLASFTNMSTETPVSDWLISPQLSGKAQTITFWARVLTSSRSTSMAFATSSTGKQIADFTINDADWTYDLNDQWRQFTYQVPAGTKYVAIYNYGCAGTMLMIDDLAYTPLGNEVLSVEAYRVYRDGALLDGNIAPVDAILNFNDASAEAEKLYRYDVSVLYNRGESPAESTLVSTSGLSTIAADAPNAYGVEGAIVVRNARGSQVAVYAVDGSLITRLPGADTLSIPIAPGYYIVTIGSTPVKVHTK